MILKKLVMMLLKLKMMRKKQKN